MRFNLARRAARDRKVHRPLTLGTAPSEAHSHQCLEYEPTDLGAKTKAENNGSGSKIVDTQTLAGGSTHSFLFDDPPRAAAASTAPKWFMYRLWQVVRKLTSNEVIKTLQRHLKMAYASDSRRARLGYKPLQKLPPTLLKSETSLHVVRLLHASTQWELHRSDLTPRERHRYDSQNRLLRHIRLALDNSQVQPDETADTIFLFGYGFVEILKNNSPIHDSLERSSSRLHCIEIFTRLIKDINAQLAEDIKKVVPNHSHISSQDYTNILARFSPSMQEGLRNGLLYDLAGFRNGVLKEWPRPEKWDDLASLIEHELSRPKKRSESRRLYETRRVSLLANAKWLRRQDTSRGPGVQDQLERDESMAKLVLMSKWRRYHLSRLKIYQGSRDGSIGTKRRMVQIQATIDEITRAITHLQSAGTDAQFTPERDIVTAGRFNRDQTQKVPVIGASIKLKPASLSDSMIFQLSRELLDSLNEAAFTFGRQYAPAMMHKGGWTAPEKIDLPIFVSSFHLYPSLVGQIIGYQKIFHRLREFRNHTAHGGGNTTSSDILLALDDFAAAARFFRSPALGAQVEQCRTLLSEFIVNQNEHLRTAYRLIRPYKEKLKAELEKTKSVSKEGEPVLDKAGTQLMASKTSMIEEAWAHVERSLLQLNADKITQFVGKAQIRRILKNMGQDASAVLTELQEEQSVRPGGLLIPLGVEHVLDSLREKLSQFETQRADAPDTEANDRAEKSAIGSEELTPELLDSLPSDWTAPSAPRANQQKQELRLLAEKVRRKD